MRFYIVLLICVIFTVWGIDRTFRESSHPEFKNQSISILSGMPGDDSLSLNFHLHIITNHFSTPVYTETVTSLNYRNDDKLTRWYQQNATDPTPVFTDIGNFGLAAIYFNEGFIDLSMEQLVKVSNKEQPGYYLLRGMILEKAGLTEMASVCYRKESAYEENRKYALIKLAESFSDNRNFAALDSLVSGTELKVSGSIASSIYLRKPDLVKYIQHKFFNNLTFFSAIAAVIISGIWFYFLVLLQVFRKPAWRMLLFTFVTSAFIAPAGVMIFDLLNYFFNITLTGKILNDIIFCIAAIGFAEETLKFIPVIFCLILFRNSVKEPFDLMLLACVSALGFSFTENILYLSNNSSLIQGRALTSTVSHMFDSSLIAYGLIRAKYRSGENMFIRLPLWLSAAAFTHGFYDFWILNEKVNQLHFITPLFMIICMVFWTTMINNTLNISPLFSYDKTPDQNTIKNYLTAGTVFIILMEYAHNAYLEGSENASLNFSVSLYSAGFFIFFYSVNFSRIDLVMNYWSHFRLSDISGKPDLNKFVNKNADLTLLPENSEEPAYTISGRITGRAVSGSNPDHYVFEADNSYRYKNAVYKKLILQISGDPTEEPYKTEIELLLPPETNQGKTIWEENALQSAGQGELKIRLYEKN
jgi:RsiW-degrading membrane proteinase PrsW (M82 family)